MAKKLRNILENRIPNSTIAGINKALKWARDNPKEHAERMKAAREKAAEREIERKKQMRKDNARIRRERKALGNG